MTASSQQIALPETLLQQAALQADHLGVSTEQWIAVALSERIRLERDTDDFFNARAARATGRSLGEILDRARNNPPVPGDEFEP